MRSELTVPEGATRAASPLALRLAVASLLVWGLTILAGRYLAYTAEILLASEGF
jgi:hypothetical protein